MTFQPAVIHFSTGAVATASHAEFFDGLPRIRSSDRRRPRTQPHRADITDPDQQPSAEWQSRRARVWPGHVIFDPHLFSLLRSRRAAGCVGASAL